MTLLLGFCRGGVELGTKLTGSNANVGRARFKECQEMSGTVRHDCDHQ